jgi:O-antigen/teichoic acid export membrane protein
MSIVQLSHNEDRTRSLEEDVAALKARNARVEADKAWETSWFRILTLTGITYVIAALVMLTVHLSRPWLSALIPAIGFFISVQSIPMLKRWWIQRYVSSPSAKLDDDRV